MIVGGSNYGQGSSREHAALAPMYLGIKVILVKSFARIHKANLINYGIIPLVFDTASDYDLIETEDILYLDGLHSFLETGSSKSGEGKIEIINTTKNTRFKASLELDERSRKILRAGGLVPYAKAGGV
jgi:aconitate hydratase